MEKTFYVDFVFFPFSKEEQMVWVFTLLKSIFLSSPLFCLQKAWEFKHFRAIKGSRTFIVSIYKESEKE